MLSDINIGLGVASDQRLTIARLTFEAFGDAGQILSRFLGGRRNAEAFVAASLRSDRLIVASMNGFAVGFAGLEYLGKSFIEPNKRQAVRMLGFSGLLVRLVFWGVVLFNRSMPGEINIRALAVSADNRGKGIGTKLLHSIIKYAKLKDFSKIKIEVTSVNPNAKRLYTRIGFRASRVQKIPNPFSTLVGFDKIIELIYKL